MPFLKRLGYFLIGLSIGLIFLTFFLKKKSDETGVEFCYLPNCRVLKELRSKPLVIDDSLQPFSDSLATRAVLEEGDVLFRKSDTEAKPCKIYVVRGQSDKQELELTFLNCESETRLKNYIKL
ncbi:DUF4258 domain-containing protein [Robiginitalea sp. IMCC43444]|uniref:DUF4258 domain-containing protein n=1 Tax=Robiginitalea sp. IMCC43444 TaxID=3459121 RepID=UPI004040EF1A